jgi:hypothetical protein
LPPPPLHSRKPIKCGKINFEKERKLKLKTLKMKKKKATVH